MRKLLFATAAIMAIGTTTAAYAQFDGPGPDAYVGAGVTQAQIDNFYGTGNGFDLNNTAWKAFVGIRPISPFAIEADYMDLGGSTRRFYGGTAHADAHGFSAFAVGFLPLPLPFMDFFGKAGAARWDLSGHTDPSFFAIDDHGTGFAWGGGAQAHFGPLGLRLEYEQFNVHDTDDIRTVSFDVSFHFL